MGINGSVESDSNNIPFNEHFYGLVNFGNTCYVNSVLQALYFCKPFREKIIQYKLQQQKSSSSPSSSSSSSNKQNKDHLLNCLADLFYSIVTMKKKKGIMQPKKFITRLRKDNESFDNLFQQDAHEFLNYLLNTCADILIAEMKDDKLANKKENYLTNGGGGGGQFDNNNINNIQFRKQLSNGGFNTMPLPTNNGYHSSTGANAALNTNTLTPSNSVNKNKTNNSQNSTTTTTTNNGNVVDSSKPTNANGTNTNKCVINGITLNSANSTNNNEDTWIHELFQGTLVNETKCLNCESSSSKEENFLDLSVDVEQNTSISHCLQEFSSMEMLCGECKYYCENCSSKQEAEKRMRIKKLPRILALHLKRFKFVEVLNKFKKLTHRVVFPFELRLFNTTEDCINGDRVYDLVSFVVHCGIGLNRGHYISVVKSHGYWFLFDDEHVEKIEVSSFEEFYGLTQDTNKKSETSYILFYESREV